MKIHHNIFGGKMKGSLYVWIITSLLIFAGLPMISAQKMQRNKMKMQGPSKYQERDFTYLLSEVKGLDQDLLTMHFTLYKGYVKNTNGLLKMLSNLVNSGQDRSYQYGALKRRLGWEFDGMRLHEYYFSNMGPKDRNEKSPLSQMIARQFGSYEKWKQEYLATGAIRGIGWVILYYDLKDKRLVNTWINEHDLGHLSGCVPLLVMDVWEHAYITQFGLDRMKYMETFFENINWDEVESRFKKAINRDG
jgi:Fe-Mn family superoxide dismutase